MQLVVYLLAYPFLWLISILPHKLFYLFSDGVFFMVYRIIGYRKKVVWNNLKLVFPEKNDEELKRIRHSFYHHMCDMFLEMVKTMSLSKQDVQERFDVVNMELLHKILKDKSILALCPHYGNWEWNVSINNYIDAKGYAVYQKIANPYFDRLIKRIRSRWNTVPITTNETPKTMMYNERNGVRAIYGMVSDQSPQAHLANYWSEFMGIKVPIYNGAEVLARKLDIAVVFLKISKVKRGYYQAEVIPISLSSKDTQKNEITEQFLRLSELQIREKPDYYLWTHKRWKHRDKVPAEFQ